MILYASWHVPLPLFFFKKKKFCNTFMFIINYKYNNIHKEFVGKDSNGETAWLRRLYKSYYLLMMISHIGLCVTSFC